MHKFSKHTARLFVVGLFIGLTAQAQKIELGASLGGMLYKGDVSPTLNPRFTQLGVGGFFRYNFTRSFSMRASGAIGTITADDQYSRDPLQLARNFSFRTPIQELSIDFEYNFLNYRSQPKAKNWSPYVFVGSGLVHYRNAVVVRGGTMMYPMGVGVKYEVKRPWSIGLEFGTRFTRSDYLDGLGDATFGNATTKTTQGNPALSDSYSYLAFTVSYTFYKIVCP